MEYCSTNKENSFFSISSAMDEHRGHCAVSNLRQRKTDAMLLCLSVKSKYVV